VPAPPPETPYVPPRWLEAILRVLNRGLEWINAHLFEPLGLALAKSGQALLLGLIVVGVAALGWLAWTLIAPWWQARRERKAQAVPEWNPVRQAALALLEDADALAAQGRFAEAVHLLCSAVWPIWPPRGRTGSLPPAPRARSPGCPPARHRAPGLCDDGRGSGARPLCPARAGPGRMARARGAYAAFALEPIGTPA
jgi:hypothetical protein